VLEKHPGVAQAVVTAREVNGEKRLAAYIVALPNTVTAGELRRYLKDLLPEYMMAGGFCFSEIISPDSQRQSGSEGFACACAVGPARK